MSTAAYAVEATLKQFLGTTIDESVLEAISLETIKNLKRQGWLRTQEEREWAGVEEFTKSNPTLCMDDLEKITNAHLPHLKFSFDHVSEDWYSVRWTDDHGFTVAYTVKLEYLSTDGPKILRSAHQRYCAWKEARDA